MEATLDSVVVAVTGRSDRCNGAGLGQALGTAESDVPGASSEWCIRFEVWALTPDLGHAESRTRDG